MFQWVVRHTTVLLITRQPGPDGGCLGTSACQEGGGAASATSSFNLLLDGRRVHHGPGENQQLHQHLQETLCADFNPGTRSSKYKNKSTVAGGPVRETDLSFLT